MPFKVPNLELLLTNTRNLDESLSNSIGRYRIISELPASPNDASDGACDMARRRLDALIARVNEVCKSDTGRVGQREVFNKLVEQLRNVGPEQSNQAFNFLVGALLHRYFRLLKEGKPLSKMTWGLFNYDPKNCRLFIAIRAALGLAPLHYYLKQEFKSADLAKIDVVTIITTLECFRKNMLVNNQYRQFHHLDKKDFFPNLDAIINEHKLRDAHTNYIKQFKAVNFIQSLARQIEKELSVLEEAFNNWMPLFKKDYPDFNKLINNDLFLQRVEDNIKKHIQEPAKSCILKIFNTPYIKRQFTEKKNDMRDYASVLGHLLDCSNNILRNLLFSGYVLINQINKEQKLKFCLDKAMTNTASMMAQPQEIDSLTSEDKIRWIKILDNYLTSDVKSASQEMVLDTSYFGSMQKLLSNVANQFIRLNDELKDQAAAHENSL